MKKGGVVAFDAGSGEQGILFFSSWLLPPLTHSARTALQTHSAALLFGADSPAIKEKRVATCQTLSGTGALTVAAHLIK
jgi:hypothetical protein